MAKTAALIGVGIGPGGRVAKRYSVEKPLREPSTKVRILSGGRRLSKGAFFFVYWNNAALKRYRAPNYAGLHNFILKEVIYEGIGP